MRSRLFGAVAVSFLLVPLVAGCAWITRASLSVGGGPANAPVYGGNISADGRFVAFESAASNLTTLDGNNKSDVFVRDLTTGVTGRASLDNSGQGLDGASGSPSISGDGRYVAFQTTARITAVDDNSFTDVYVRDMVAGTTTLVSVDRFGQVGDHWSGKPSISDDGRMVAFVSEAKDLAAGDTDEGSDLDVFVRNLRSGITRRVSTDRSGGEPDHTSSGAAISGDGTHVAFASLGLRHRHRGRQRPVGRLRARSRRRNDGARQRRRRRR